MKLWKRKHYEPKFDTDPKTVDDYFAIIAEAHHKINELQIKCKHEITENGWFAWRPGAMQPSKMCKICHVRVGDVTEEESQKMWNKLHKEHS